MYVLLNLRDASRLSDVVQLLFSHGHTAVSVAETIGDLCPCCQRFGHLLSDPVEQPESEIAEQAPVAITDFKPALTPTSLETFFLPSECPLRNGEAVQSHMSSHSFFLPSEEIQSNRTETLEYPVEKVKSRERRSQRSTSKSTPQSSTTMSDVKDLQTRCKQTNANVSETVWNEDIQLTSTSSFDLLTNTCNAVGLCQERDGQKVDTVTKRSAPSSKRMARIEELGLETFQCQLCKKAITRQGHLSNLVNHLSRHSRLHASRKQYCCPVCRASFTRRYLAYSHTREAHSKHGHIEPVDYGRELREEYKALLEVCFPGASNRRRRRSRAVAKATTRRALSLEGGIPP